MQLVLTHPHDDVPDLHTLTEAQKRGVVYLRGDGEPELVRCRVHKDDVGSLKVGMQCRIKDGELRVEPTKRPKAKKKAAAKRHTRGE